MPLTNPNELSYLEPGMLYQRIIEQSQYALACGALQPIETESTYLKFGEIQFLVRVLANLERKDHAKKNQGKTKDFNPFLPYDPDLLVGQLSETHVALLNKYNAVENHLLIVTRAFEAQESLLTPADFSAAIRGLEDIDGLIFYNSGKAAGASQRHKHLQLVPLPLVTTGVKFPLEPWINAILPLHSQQLQSLTIRELPFCHQLMALPPLLKTDSSGLTSLVHHGYLQALQSLKLIGSDSPTAIPKPYNLLLTREWLWLIPRSQKSYQDIEINSLGFVGAFLVRKSQQLEQITHNHPRGPLTFLKKVACPWS